jgi:hypothetical protein
MEYGDSVRDVESSIVGKDKIHVHDWVKVIRED